MNLDDFYFQRTGLIWLCDISSENRFRFFVTYIQQYRPVFIDFPRFIYFCLGENVGDQNENMTWKSIGRHKDVKRVFEILIASLRTKKL